MDSYLIIASISIIFMLLGASLWQRNNQLIAKGKKAQGIIFKNNQNRFKNDGLYFPVVRFLTENQEWITQELSIGQNPPMQEGKKVLVVYDPEDPTEVEINSTFRLEVLPRLLVALGLFGFIVSLLLYTELIII